AVDRVRDRRADARHADEVLLRVLHALLDRVRDRPRLAEAVADLAVAVADDDQRREREAPPALHDLGAAVHLDDDLLEDRLVRVALVAAAAIVASATRSIVAVGGHVFRSREARPRRRAPAGPV